MLYRMIIDIAHKFNPNWYSDLTYKYSDLTYKYSDLTYKYSDLTYKDSDLTYKLPKRPSTCM